MEFMNLEKIIKKDFDIYILSNSFNTKKLDKISKTIDIPFIGYSLKPFSFGYRRLKLSNSRKEIAMIGDQMITDVWGAKRMGYFSILIDPIDMKSEIIFTKFNRMVEENLLAKAKKVKRGKYYD